MAQNYAKFQQVLDKFDHLDIETLSKLNLPQDNQIESPCKTMTGERSLA